MTTVQIEPGLARNAILMARAVNPGHKIRQNILDLLLKNGKMTVTEIYTNKVFRNKQGVYLEQSQASQHLAILRHAGLVDTERQGKNILYSVNENKLNAALGLFAQLGDLYGRQEG